jgi:hypothetical protein
LIEGAYYAERSLLGAALCDHLFVARLEDVQRQRRTGQKNDFERKQSEQRHGISGDGALVFAAAEGKRVRRLYARAAGWS